MEKNDIQVTQTVQHEDRFPMILLLATVLLLAELGLRATVFRVEV